VKRPEHPLRAPVLVQPVVDQELFTQRDTVVRGFASMYRTQAAEFPGGCGEASYERRLQAAYPIHPELFERLYSYWSSLERFQRTHTAGEGKILHDGEEDDLGADDVIRRVDRLTAPYGGLGAYPRADQASHEFVENKIQQLRGTALVAEERGLVPALRQSLGEDP